MIVRRQKIFITLSRAIFMMQLKDVQKLELPASGDFHVHLRDGEMMKTVVPTIRQGGVDVVYVMVCAY